MPNPSTQRPESSILTQPSSPTQAHAFSGGPKIVAVETLIPTGIMPGLLLLRVHTDAGTIQGQPCVGHGETYYVPGAAAAVIHDFISHRLLGADALAVESHWRFLYERMTAFGGVGAELRALSAVDLALWDIKAQLAEQPLWRLLGGPTRDAVPVYNSCGGPFYGVRQSNEVTAGWPGHGDPGREGPLEDNWASVHAPGDLAEELLAEGITAMKLWSFDEVYREAGGLRLSSEQIRRGVEPFEAIRARVGDKVDVMLDGHGFFALPAALDIAHAMTEFRPLWVEDVLRPDSVRTMAQFRRESHVPVAVSEMLVTREQYRQALDADAADYAMIDPTWVGGISEARRIAELAQLYNVPVLMHDCTGPLTFLAGVHLSASIPGVTYQECVRAHLRTLYPHLIDVPLELVQGKLPLPQRSGIGARWLESLFDDQQGDYQMTKWASA